SFVALGFDREGGGRHAEGLLVGVAGMLFCVMRARRAAIAAGWSGCSAAAVLFRAASSFCLLRSARTRRVEEEARPGQQVMELPSEIILRARSALTAPAMRSAGMSSCTENSSASKAASDPAGDA